jgi:putative addiction module component (TIGR02574 family)
MEPLPPITINADAVVTWRRRSNPEPVNPELWRIQLVEDIWDSIAADITLIELTEKERRLLAARLAAYHLDPTAGSPWEEIYQRITQNYEL